MIRGAELRLACRKLPHQCRRLAEKTTAYRQTLAIVWPLECGALANRFPVDGISGLLVKLEIGHHERSRAGSGKVRDELRRHETLNYVLDSPEISDAE